MKKIKFGIVGLNFGGWFANSLKHPPASDYVEFAAVCDIDREKADRIAQLQAEGEALRAERSNLQQAQAAAITKYLGAIKAANPALPPDTIAGETIEDIDASLPRGTTIAAAGKASLQAQAKETRIPAGAPTRALDLSALSPDEKIRVGLQQSKIPT